MREVFEDLDKENYPNYKTIYFLTDSKGNSKEETVKQLKKGKILEYLDKTD